MEHIKSGLILDDLIFTLVIGVLRGSHPALGNQHIHHLGYQVVSTSF